MSLIAADSLGPALKRLARVKHIQQQMTDQWSVLATLTPTEYAQFRGVLGKSSGFQSMQYRLLEFLLFLARRGYPVPARLTQRDWRLPHVLDDELVAVFTGIYNEPERQWDVYEACEELVDVEDTFQTWRFRHLKTVERVIGFKKGTGGSSGVSFLRRALDLTFFPELYAVRTEIGR